MQLSNRGAAFHQNLRCHKQKKGAPCKKGRPVWGSEKILTVVFLWSKPKRPLSTPEQQGVCAGAKSPLRVQFPPAGAGFHQESAHQKRKSPQQVTSFFGGDGGIRTLDLTDANRTLSQLSYAPIYETARAEPTQSKLHLRIAQSLKNVKYFTGANGQKSAGSRHL